MAGQVGTPVTATADAGAATIASPPKSTTTLNANIGGVKWETAGVTVGSVTDTQLNTYQIIQAAHPTGGEPSVALFYSVGATGDPSNVITVHFVGGNATFRRMVADEFSGVSSILPVDGTPTTNSGTGGGGAGSYSTGAITTTLPGLMYAMIADFNGLSVAAAGGSPAATLSGVLSDAFAEFLISATGQTITPGASVSGGITKWMMAALALKDIAGPAITTQPNNATVYQGQTVNFTIAAVSSGGTLHYQWKLNGSNVGTDSNSYTTGTLAASDDSSIVECDVSDDNGTTSSNNAIIRVMMTSAMAWISA